MADHDKRKQQHERCTGLPTKTGIKKAIDDQESIEGKAARANSIDRIREASAAKHAIKISRNNDADSQNRYESNQAVVV